jgi:tetratricopeptide (TPR) repeat protein
MNRSRYKVTLLVLSIFLGALAVFLSTVYPVASAQSLQRIFSAANEAYFRGDHAAAAEQYESLVRAGVNDADVYYNLATAQAQAGQLGKAILYFERALRLDPGDEAAEAALAACREALGKRLAEKKGEALVQARPPLIEALVRPLSENLLAWLVLFFDLLLFCSLVALRFAAREPVRVGLGVAAPLLGLLLLLAGAGLLIKSEALEQGRAGVVLVEDARLREGPDPRAGLRGRLVEGQGVRILAREGGFLRVRIAGGNEGWLAAGEAEEI